MVSGLLANLIPFRSVPGQLSQCRDDNKTKIYRSVYFKEEKKKYNT